MTPLSRQADMTADLQAIAAAVENPTALVEMMLLIVDRNFSKRKPEFQQTQGRACSPTSTLVWDAPYLFQDN